MALWSYWLNSLYQFALFLNLVSSFTKKRLYKIYSTGIYYFGKVFFIGQILGKTKLTSNSLESLGHQGFSLSLSLGFLELESFIFPSRTEKTQKKIKVFQHNFKFITIVNKKFICILKDVKYIKYSHPTTKSI